MKMSNHLAYLPVYKVTKVWEFEDKKNIHKCSVCYHDIIDLGTVLTRMHNSNEFSNDFVQQIQNDIKGIETKKENHFMIKHITHGAVMAFTGEKTTTYVCNGCVQDLLNLVTRELLNGDSNITYQINKMKRATMFSSFTSSPALNQNEIEVVEKIQKKIEAAPKHTATLGDFTVLQNLKNKMDAEEKIKNNKNE